ncbi:PE-PPE domain-containing protein [Mycobacterium adipatum]|uniref:PE-PPE domain-containing protein n=1 Tax=Mycobacterium adipatum TaxID=1682113 RepID=UPI0034E0D313
MCATLIATPAVAINPAPAQAADSVFFLSGTRDNPAPQQVIDLADIGAALTYFGEQALQIGYAAALFPFQGATPFDMSVAEGLANLIAALGGAPAGDRLVLIGVSQGDIVLSLLEHGLAVAGSTRDVLFVRMAGPSGDTGIMGRNWGFELPGLSFVTRPKESPFDQIVLNHEYDGLGHWPADQLNLLAVANAALGMLTFHNPNAYAVDLANFPLADTTTTVNSLGATTTTYLIRATGLLPLLRPLQALGVNAGLLDDWQRVLKPIIDSAYEPDQVPVLARVVQSMVRVVVNGLSRVAEGVGTVLRRIEAPRRPGTATPIEAVADADDQAVTGRAEHDPPSLSPTAPAPVSASREAVGDPVPGTDHAVPQSNTEDVADTDSQPAHRADPPAAQDIPAALAAVPLDGLASVVDVDEPGTRDSAGSQDDATSITVGGDSAAGEERATVVPAGAGQTASTRTRLHIRDSRQAAAAGAVSRPRSPRVVSTSSRSGSPDSDNDRGTSGSSPRKDASRTAKDSGAGS